MPIGVAIARKRDTHRLRSIIALVLVLIAGEWGLAGCSGVVSGNNATNTANPPSGDTTPPQVTITSPGPGATLSGSVNVTANATDNVAVASVQFKIDGANTGPALTATPYAYSLNTSSLSNAGHSITAVATDTSGNSATSSAVTVTVNNATSDTTPPTVTMTAPANGATVSGTVSITANASDNVSVASVQFQLDGANLGSADTASPYAFSWNTATASNGSHSLRAIAKDGAGNSTTSASVTVTVSNTADTSAPSVPAGLSANAASSSQINLSWTASTDNVGVTGYNVFRGGTKIGTAPGTSYQDGGLSASTSYSYTVSAFDAAGNTSAQSASASATTQGAASGGGIPSTLGWYQIPNTSLQSLCPPYSEIQAIEGCPAVMADWSGGLFDTKRDELIVHGGGHTGYYGNEIYGISLGTTAPSLVKDASHGTAVSNVGTCPDAYTDGNPVAVHTYDGLVYLPTQDKYLRFSGSKANCGFFTSALWTYDPGTSTWARQSPTGGGPNPAQSGGPPLMAYDSTTDSVYDVDSNTGEFWKYSPASTAWTDLANVGIKCPQLNMNAAIDPVRRLYFCVGNTKFGKISLNSPFTATALAGTGCSTLVNTNAPGFAYDPVQQLMVGWAGGNTVYLYNPDTDSCTTQTFTGGPPSPQTNGTYGRFQYSPKTGVFIVANSISQNAFTLRLTAGSGTGGTTGPVISAVGVNSITQTSATAGWTTDVGSTTQVEYGTSTAYGTLTTLNSSMVTTHSQAVSGLAAGTLYHYRVHSKNSTGVESISGDFAFSTNTTGDTTAPTVSITSPASGATVSGTVSLTASASDNVGVVSVQFLIDGTNLGSLILASPYQAGWNTTAVSNGTHTITAVALDAAGNVGTAIGVTVTVSNSGTTSSALQDFQTRCAQSGVIVCQGFDDPAGIPHAVWPGSGALPANNGTSYPTQDTSITASGQGSLRFDIPTPSGSSNPDGYWRQLTQASLSADATTAQLFGQNSTFYVQFRQRMSAAYISNTWGGSTYFKQDIIAVDSSTCGQQELTTVNGWNRGFPQMYSACGQDPFQPAVGTSDYLLEQGDTSSSGYNCHYQTANNTSTSCFMYPADTWVTYYYKVQIGSWGQANSTIQAWVSVGGQPYKEWINMPNHTLNLDGGTIAPGYNAVYLTPYWTNGYSGASGPATTWYDELIISTQPIAAPNN